ncbi:hypothetical protein KP509_25G044400 [Ceratopteris richardii]|uniref:Uncharacterized protein n=1 Tax=Ceratopteris richardii TaxID=49495 RepID=A0A8T2RSG7_CERRI|nr:hypothetical protein KP509_25G044400 [Ceratopteris richardii]
MCAPPPVRFDAGALANYILGYTITA